MDLNPECVDINADKVKIVFTDSEAEEVLRIYLGKEEAWQLSKMLNHKLNMLYKPSIAEKKLNPLF